MNRSHLREEEESIYNLIPKLKEKPPRPDRYTSKHANTVKGEYQSTKMGKTCKIMGPAKVPLNQPEEFLKKHSKEPRLPNRSDFRYGDENQRKPPVPHHTEKPLMGIQSGKNFITTNAVDNIMSVPKKAAANFVDTKDGASHALDQSGLTPKYVNKKDYGKTPVYLSRRKADMEKAQQEYDSYIKESFKKGALQQMSDAERHAVISGLKKNWEDIHHQYQGLSVVTDTAPKKNRKERMEAEMNQLEKDIELLEKHPVIYITSTGLVM